MKNKYGKQETTNRKVGSFFVDKNCAEFRYMQKTNDERSKKMREKGKRLIAIILSCLLLLSNVTVYAATETEAQSDTQNTVSVSDSEEAVTLPEEPTNGSAGEEAAIQIQNEPNDEDTSGETEETETSVPINETDPSEILETPKNMVGIELSSFNFLLTTRSVGIPTIGSTATGTCYIGDSWNVNYPYQDYFYVNNFTGDLAGAVTVQDFECLDPTAALPTHKNASYEATVTEVNAAGGYIEYYEWNGNYIPRNDEIPPLSGYEAQLLENAGAAAGSIITGYSWNGDAYLVNGVLCRDAIANVQQPVQMYRAEYSGVIQIPKETVYKAIYETEDVDGAKEYTVKATAVYAEKKTVLPYILTGAGILILIGAVIAILMMLSKKKKEEQEK